MLVDIETVKQADRNPNQGDVDAIAESIVLNGYAVPVIARRDTREIIAGNHRYAALLSLGAVYTHEDLSRFHQIIENPLSFDSGNDARQRVGAKSVFECPECGHRWGPGLRVTPSEDYL